MKRERKTIYDDSSAFYEEFLNTFFADISYYNTLLQVVRPCSILEIGCGCGRLFKVYLNHCNDVTGIDLSEELIGAAKQSYPTVTLKIANIVSFNLERTFDLIVISNSLLKHIKDEKDRIKVLRNVKKHLSDRGIVSFDHSDYLYYESHTTDWITAADSIAAKWFPNENNILSKMQWRKRVYDVNDNILWRKANDNNSFEAIIEYEAYKYSIFQLQKHLTDVGLFYECVLTDYEKKGLNNEGSRFIAIAGTNIEHLDNIKQQFRAIFSSL